MPGKRVQFDDETWHALDLLARDRMTDFQELADEAFADLLKKHGQPSNDNDRGGANKKVSASGSRAGNLHHFWDTEFVDQLETDPKSIASDLIGHISKAQERAWEAGSPADSAKESFQVAKADAYG